MSEPKPELLKAAILGAVQGLTEFLPISSTGHLILFEEALGVDQDTFGLTFDAAIHLGTLLSILVLLRHEVLRLTLGWLGSVRNRRLDGNADARLAWLILLATAPAAVLGLALEGAVGFAVAAVAGAVAIAFLLRFLQRNPLYVFVWYRVALWLAVLGDLAAR